MNQLSVRLTGYLVGKKLIPVEERDIYEYGFICFFELSTSVLCSVFLALLFGMWLECLLFFFFFIPVRSLGGGLHMDKFRNCVILSCVTLALLFFLVKSAVLPAPVSFFSFAAALAVLIAIGPVDHPDMEVDSGENVRFQRRISLFFILHIITAVIFWIAGLKKYLYLEALVYILVALTAFLGKIKYRRAE